MVRILKSMPMVVMKEGVNESSEKRRRQQDFPTPESPMRTLAAVRKVLEREQKRSRKAYGV